MKNIFRSLALVALLAGVVSCKDKATTEEATTTTETVETQSEQTPEVDNTTVEINSNDQMQFDVPEIVVPVGKTITLTLNHTGTMAKTAMGHNFVILKQGVDMQKFAEAAAAAADTEYIPASEAANIIAHTKLIGGGESDTIEFTINEAGSYDFLCSFPGHYAMMKGKVIVE